MENDNEPKMIIVVRKDLHMRSGKIAAQVAHAAMKFLFRAHDRGARSFTFCAKDKAEHQWITERFKKVVVSVDSEQELRDLIAAARNVSIEVNDIVDAGLTEFHGVPTLTCAALGPDLPSRLDPLTGKLSLL